MAEKILAIVVLAVCLVLMARLFMGQHRRHRFDAFARRIAFVVKRRAYLIYHWRSARRNAANAAEEAIRRARAQGDWDGNVYKPKSFKRPRKPH